MASYKQTLDYLYTQLPMFTRVGEAAYKPNLENTIRLLNALGNPQESITCIHIAGTNGKGSTSNMLAAILQCAGYKTGLYTSPHLLDFRERIRINGIMIPKEYVVKFVAKHKSLFQEIQPSFFEMTVALCFQYFADSKIEFAVIETGLGGRLDSTNVIHPLISIITNIGLDHTNLLGNTLAEIAVEKAGIIKAKVPVVIGETDTHTKNVFRAKAKEMGSKIIFADQQWKLELIKHAHDAMTVNAFHKNNLVFDALKISLAGNYQLKNITTVLQSIASLPSQLDITEADIRRGLAHVQKFTGFAGRWQVMQKHPLVILDTGHNAHGLQLSLQQLKDAKKDQINMVFGVVQDKKLDDIIPLLPRDAHYFLCAPKLPRALPVQELADLFKSHQFNFSVCKNVVSAYQKAYKKCKKNDILFVGGSTFVVAEALQYLNRKNKIKK